MEYSSWDDQVKRPGVLARWPALIVLTAGILGVFAGRTYLAHAGNPPSLFTIFDTITIVLSLVVLTTSFRTLKLLDWIIALVTATILGAILPLSGFNSLGGTFLPPGQPVARMMLHGICLFVVLLAGITVVRHGGPVRVRLVGGEWGKAGSHFLVGAVFGVPLAILNVLAFTQMQGRAPVWPSPTWTVISALSALEPGIIEEVVYRLTFLGIVWFLLRPGWPDRAVLIAAVLSVVVHGYSHLDAMLVDQPLFALAYGAMLSLVFGAPMAYLAVRRDLETAAGFHWIQDALRFLAGF